MMVGNETGAMESIGVYWLQFIECSGTMNSTMYFNPYYRLYQTPLFCFTFKFWTTTARGLRYRIAIHDKYCQTTTGT